MPEGGAQLDLAGWPQASASTSLSHCLLYGSDVNHVVLLRE